MRITQINYIQNNNKNYKHYYKVLPAFSALNLNTTDSPVKEDKKCILGEKIIQLLSGKFLAGIFGLYLTKNKNSSMTDSLQQNNNKQNIIPQKATGKIQSDKIFEIEEFIENSMLLEEFLKLHPNIDINSRNKNGDTLVLKAIRENNYDILYKLQKQEKNGIITGIDWNAADTKGKNGLMIAIEQIDAREIEYLEDNNPNIQDLMITAEKLNRDRNTVNRIKYLLELGIDPNYINHKTKFQNYYCTPLQEIIIVGNIAALNEMLKFPKTDVSVSHPNTPPSLFLINNKIPRQLNIFEEIAEHPSCDLKQEYKGKNICEYISSQNNNIWSQKDMIRIVERIMTQNACESLKKYYQDYGELTLEQLYNYSQLPQLRNVVENPLNELEQNIAHFAAGIHIDGYEQLKKMNVIAKQILQSNHTTLFKKDALGRTSFDIACEAENYKFLQILLSTANETILFLSKYEIQNSLKNLPKEQFHIIYPLVREIYTKKNIPFYI